MLIVHLLTLFSVSSATTCDTYSCSPLSSNFSCYNYNLNSRTVGQSPCILGTTCDVSDFYSSVTCTLPNIKGSVLPGDYCASATDCVSGRCLSNQCAGLLNGNSCTSTAQCIPGYYCSKTCTPLIAIGGTCTSEYQCVNGASCDFGKCVPFFSLEVGKNTSELQPPNFAISCQTGYASTNFWGYNCAVAPVSLVQINNPCNSTGVCYDSNNETYKYCQCGLDGSLHCPLFEGDTYVQSMIASMKEIMVNNCHVMEPFSPRCFIKSNNETLWNMYLEWAHLATLYFDDVFVLNNGATKCQQQANLQYYLNIVSQLNNSQPACPTYNCNFNINQPGNCVFYDTNYQDYSMINAVFVSNCSTGYYCNAAIGSNATCELVVQAPSYPGQNCTSNANCITQQCINSICVGNSVGAACENDTVCSPGLYCGYASQESNATCIQSSKAGQNCSSSLPCSSSLLCDSGVCVESFSLALGAKTSIYANGFAPACQYGYAVLQNSSYVCELAPTSNYTVKMCSTDSDCYDTSSTITSTCQCSFDGNRYCNMFEGNSYLQNAIANYKKLSSIECNRALGWVAGCFESNLVNLLTYYYYSTNLTMYNDFPLLQSNVTCTKSTYMSGYYNGLKMIDEILNILNPPGPGPKPHHDFSKMASYWLALTALLVI